MIFRILTVLLICGSAFAQKGDKGDEKQTPLVPRSLIPAAPVLTPEQALKTIKVAPGFHVELVAAEPLVHEPIQVIFDPDGRMWVLELRGYMPDVDGTHELEPAGSVAMLEDTNGDGKMDKRTEVISGL